MLNGFFCFRLRPQTVKIATTPQGRRPLFLLKHSTPLQSGVANNHLEMRSLRTVVVNLGGKKRALTLVGGEILLVDLKLDAQPRDESGDEAAAEGKEKENRSPREKKGALILRSVVADNRRNQAANQRNTGHAKAEPNRSRNERNHGAAGGEDARGESNEREQGSKHCADSAEDEADKEGSAHKGVADVGHGEVEGHNVVAHGGNVLRGVVVERLGGRGTGNGEDCSQNLRDNHKSTAGLRRHVDDITLLQLAVLINEIASGEEENSGSDNVDRLARAPVDLTNVIGTGGLVEMVHTHVHVHNGEDERDDREEKPNNHRASVSGKRKEGGERKNGTGQSNAANADEALSAAVVLHGALAPVAVRK